MNARIVNDSCVKKRPHMPNREELLKQFSAELSREPSNLDIHDRSRLRLLAPKTSKHCNVAVTSENVSGYYRFSKGFYGAAEIPTISQEKIDRKLGHQTPVWLDDIIVVSRGAKEEHTRNLYSVLTKFEREGYRASTQKSNFTKNNIARTNIFTRRNKT